MVVVMVVVMIGAGIIVVVMVVMMMMMVVVRVVVIVLRESHVWVPLGLRLGTCCVRRVHGLQQGGRIWDRLEQLRIGLGVHDFGYVWRG